MRRMMVVIVLVVIVGVGWSVPKRKGDEHTRQVDVSAANSCVCYCESTKIGPGGVACMGGWLMICQDRNGDGRNCGWDNVKNGKDDVRCNGRC